MTTTTQTNYSFTTPEGYEVLYAIVTPDMAAEMLDANTNNRNVKTHNLAKIGDDMISGRWKFNGDTICIDENGVILDGQHRLIQIEKTGTAIRTLLVTGLPPEVRATIDTNAVRSAADELQMQGYLNTHALAALTASLIRLESAGLRGAVDASAAAVNQRASTTTSRIIAKVQNEPWILEVSRSSGRRHYKSVTRTMGATLHYAFSQLPSSTDDADFFFARLRDGAQLPMDSPILRLRHTLDSLYANKRNRPNSSYVAGLTIKAWNAFRQGTPVRSLSYRIGGANPERFPEPI